MYSYEKSENKKNIKKKKAKGIEKDVIAKNIKHENLKKTLFKSTQMKHEMKIIKSDYHQLKSYNINKISLSCFDNKRYIRKNGNKNLCLWAL